MGRHAFLFSDGQMTDLNDLIDPALGITLAQAPASMIRARLWPTVRPVPTCSLPRLRAYLNPVQRPCLGLPAREDGSKPSVASTLEHHPDHIQRIGSSQTSAQRISGLAPLPISEARTTLKLGFTGLPERWYGQVGIEVLRRVRASFFVLALRRSAQWVDLDHSY